MKWCFRCEVLWLTFLRKKGVLFCVVDSAAFAYDIDLYLTGIFEFRLDSRNDLACNNDHLIIVYVFGLDHYADLASRLYSVRFFNAGEAVRYLFKFLKSLDIVIEIFSASSGARRGYSVCRRNEHRRNSFRFNISVVSFYRMNDFFVFLEFTRYFNAELYMRAFDFLRKRYA